MAEEQASSSTAQLQPELQEAIVEIQAFLPYLPATASSLPQNAHRLLCNVLQSIKNKAERNHQVWSPSLSIAELPSLLLLEPKAVGSQCGISVHDAHVFLDALAQLFRPCFKLVQQPSLSGSIGPPSTPSSAINPYITTDDETLDRLLFACSPVHPTTSAEEDVDESEIGTVSGIRLGTVVELTGEASSGKTQLLLQLVYSVYANTGGSSIFLSSEGTLRTSRLLEIAHFRHASKAQAARVPDTIAEDLDEEALLSSVHFLATFDPEALLHALQFALPPLLDSLQDSSDPRPGIDSSSARSKRPARLIILDSLTALFRGSDETSKSARAKMIERSSTLTQIGDTFAKLAHEYQCAIIIVNQISDVASMLVPQFAASYESFAPSSPTPTIARLRSIESTSSGSSFESGSQPSSLHPSHLTSAGHPALDCIMNVPPVPYSLAERYFSGQATLGNATRKAAMGLVWAQCVHARIMLSRTGRRREHVPEDHQSEAIESLSTQQRTVLLRRATIAFAPWTHAPDSAVDYTVDHAGLHAFVPSNPKRKHRSFHPQITPSTLPQSPEAKLDQHTSIARPPEENQTAEESSLTLAPDMNRDETKSGTWDHEHPLQNTKRPPSPPEPTELAASTTLSPPAPPIGRVMSKRLKLLCQAIVIPSSQGETALD